MRMLGIVEHIGEIREDIAEADSRECEDQEQHCQRCDARGKEKERADREHLAFQRDGNILVFQQQMRAHAGGVEQP